MYRIVLFLVTISFSIGCSQLSNEKNLTKENPPITPKWALGHIVWEDSINTQISATNLVKQYANNNIPVNGVIIDSPWSLSYNDFSWDPSRYPHPEKMIQNFNSQNVKVILWLTGCINSTARDVPVQLHPEFDYAKNKKYVVNNGEESKWWKGMGMHLDFTNKEAVKWWNSKLDKVFIDGVYGWKVDQGENNYGGSNDSVITSVGEMPLRDFKYYYYDSMYDYVKSREKEGITLARPYSHQAQKGNYAARISKLSVGWCGDFSGDWNGLKLQLNNIYISAKAGYGALACEIGGFNHNRSSKKELLRYAQFGSMCATMINGGANGAFTNHLPWYHDKETTDIYRYFANLHHELSGYMFSELVNAHQNGGSLMKDVSLKDESHKVGNNIFFKAITSDINKVTINLPKVGTWVDFWSNEKYKAGSVITKEYSLDKAPIFIRAGAIIPLEIRNNVTGIGDETFAGKTTLLVYPTNGKSHYLYHKPDGDGVEYKDIDIMYDNGKISVNTKWDEEFIFLIKLNKEVKSVEGCDSFNFSSEKQILKVEKKGKSFNLTIEN